MSIKKVSLDRNVFNNCVADAKSKLIGDEKKLIPIPNALIGVKKSKLPTDIPSKSGLYAIWSNDELMYVGEVGDSLKLRGRLKQHLCSCSASTASKLIEVKKECAAHKEIFVSVIHVEPVPFRLALEDEIIRIVTDEGKAPWNKRSASAGEKKKWVLNRIKQTNKDLILAMVNGNVCAANQLQRKLKVKKSIPEDVLQAQFIEEFGKTANYDEVIRSLISEGKVVPTQSGLEIPIRKRKKKN